MEASFMKYTVIIGLVTAAVFPALVSAHHAHQVVANYDALLAVTGVVTKHEFINPHALIHVEATDKNGNKEEWVGYGGTPSMESRLGYSPHMFKVGEERITMYGFPNKDGKKLMLYVKMVRANGQDIPIYQTMKNDLDAFMREHSAKTFKEIPESIKKYIGGQAFQASVDK
jgi:hypothetical protein